MYIFSTAHLHNRIHVFRVPEAVPSSRQKEQQKNPTSILAEVVHSNPFRPQVSCEIMKTSSNIFGPKVGQIFPPHTTLEKKLFKILLFHSFKRVVPIHHGELKKKNT